MDSLLRFRRLPRTLCGLTAVVGLCSSARVALAEPAASTEAVPPAPPAAPAPGAPAEPPAASAEAAAPAESSAPPEASPAPPAPAPPETPKEPQPPPASSPAAGKAPSGDVMAHPGYVPGYRRYSWVGLPPYVPHSPTPFGNVVSPYGAPTPPDEWNFRYSGFFAAGAHASLRSRELANVTLAPYQSSTAIRNSADYGSSFGAGSVLGSWVQMNFDYGNRVATAHVTIDTWNPSRGASFPQLGSENFIDQAYLTFRIPDLGRFRLGVTLGAFSINYGPLGQYGGGFYNNAVARVYGIGQQVSAEYALTDQIVLTGDWGLHSSGDKAPDGAPSGLGDSYDPAAWVHHAHVGVIKKGDIALAAQLHFLHNFSHDDRGLLPRKEPSATGSQSDWNPDPRPETPTGLGAPVYAAGIDESVRQDDGSYDALGANFTLLGQGFRGGIGFVRGSATNAYALHGMTVSYVGDGEAFSTDWLGPRSFDVAKNDWVGSMWSTAFEVEVSWGNLWRKPEPFWGDGVNVTTAVGFQYGQVRSRDEERGNWNMYRGGFDVVGSFLPWLGAELRIDRVAPVVSDPAQSYTAMMTQLVFRTDWNSRERVSLQYTKWFYGDAYPMGYKPQPTDPLDSDVVSFGFGMWW